MCLFRRKKKEVDELAEYENNINKNYYTYDENANIYDDRKIEEACFVTTGDIFQIRDLIVVCGVTLKEVSVGDTIIIGDKELTVKKIEMFRKQTNSTKPGDNAALAFKKDKSLKTYILDLAQEQSKYNQPINLDGKPTTVYTFLYKK